MGQKVPGHQGDTGPSPEGYAPLYFKKAQPPENIPFQNSPTPLKSELTHIL